MKPSDVFNWYFQGYLGNPVFKEFYNNINMINNGVMPDFEKSPSKNDFSKNKTFHDKDAGSIVTKKDTSSEEEYMLFKYADGIHFNKIKRLPKISKEPPVQNDEIPEGEYLISEYGDGWSYKTFIGGEKIFIISNELETLKSKVRKQNLPLD